MSIKYQYNVTSKKRRALAETIGEILHQPVIYTKAPSYSYTIDFCVLDRSGMLSFLDDTSSETILNLVEQLRGRGYFPEIGFGKRYALTVEMPRKDFDDRALDNLKKIISSKKTVFKKALKARSLKLIVTEDTIRFPWFTLYGNEGETDAYLRFVHALCQMAKEQKRVTAKEKESQNDKFTMRLFLVRLGFIGDEYKTARKILLSHLSGNGSWKAGHQPGEIAQEVRDTAKLCTGRRQ